MARYEVVWWAMVEDGATRKRDRKVYFVNGATERAAKDSARDIMRNAGHEPDERPESVTYVHG